MWLCAKVIQFFEITIGPSYTCVPHPHIQATINQKYLGVKAHFLLKIHTSFVLIIPKHNRKAFSMHLHCTCYMWLRDGSSIEEYVRAYSTHKNQLNTYEVWFLWGSETNPRGQKMSAMLHTSTNIQTPMVQLNSH